MVATPDTATRMRYAPAANVVGTPTVSDVAVAAVTVPVVPVVAIVPPVFSKKVTVLLAAVVLKLVPVIVVEAAAPAVLLVGVKLVMVGLAALMV